MPSEAFGEGGSAPGQRDIGEAQQRAQGGIEQRHEHTAKRTRKPVPGALEEALRRVVFQHRPTTAPSAGKAPTHDAAGAAEQQHDFNHNRPQAGSGSLPKKSKRTL